jgi:GMP synthase-like glutamine amidotransferase
MQRESKDLRILLMQARNLDDPVKTEERAAFAQKAGLPLSCFISHDLLEGPPTLNQVQQFDALMIGGSGDFNVSDRSLPYMEKTFELLQDVVKVAHPTFASCFGFQMLVEALGGRIVKDPESMEIGAYEVTLTEPGKEDDLFNYLPETFSAHFPLSSVIKSGWNISRNQSSTWHPVNSARTKRFAFPANPSGPRNSIRRCRATKTGSVLADIRRCT